MTSNGYLLLWEGCLLMAFFVLLLIIAHDVWKRD